MDDKNENDASMEASPNKNASEVVSQEVDVVMDVSP